MKKQTIFSRFFLVTAAVVFAAVLLVTLLQYELVTKYISKEHEEILITHARTLVKITENENSTDKLYDIISSYAIANNYDAVLLDKNGLIKFKETAGNISEDYGKYVNYKHIKKVLSGQENIIKGDLDNLFDEKMIIAQTPIINCENDNVVGAILLSTPVPKELEMNIEIFKISIASMLIAMVLALIFSYIFSMNISKPIKSIGESVKKLAKGDFSERVKLWNIDYSIAEICDLAQSFNDMASDIEQFEDVRMNFISDVSHELRTPITTINGFIDGILDETVSDDKKDEYLKIVQNEVKRLSRLVNTFLDIAKLKDGKIKIKPEVFELNEVIRLAIIKLEQSIASKDINVNIDFCSEVCYVKADIDAVKQVLTNLLSNAAKFTDNGGYISVYVTSQKQHEVCVSVYNTGCGIPENELPFVFERFYKVDKSRSINREGTGIGLYMVKNIMAAHGKSINVESKEGEYAQFSFSLDKAKSM